MSEADINGTIIFGAGAATIVLGSALAFLIMQKNKKAVSAAPVVVKETVEELDKSKFPGGHLTIYFGSQTGTAESFAQDMEREGEENGFKVHVVDLEETEEDVPGELLNKHKRTDAGRNITAFLMATYGEGEPTDNAAPFIRFLKSNIGHDDASSEEEKKGEDVVPDTSTFAGLDFAVFGLGNKQYEHFNAMGNFVDVVLEKLGGQRIIPVGVGDDDDDLEGDFETWKDKKFWPALKAKYINTDVADSNNSTSQKLPDCHIAVQYTKASSSDEDGEQTPKQNIHLSSKHYFSAVDCPVTLKRELRDPTDDGSTLHVEIDISEGGDEVKYQTADNLGILPINASSDVENLARALDYDLDAMFKLIPAAGQEKKFSELFPSPCSVRECLSRYCDLTGSPRRSELKRLAAYAKNPICKKALLRLASKDGKAEYKDKILEAKMGMVHIVSKLCPSIEMPLDHFISICPRLTPRYYTISSSSTLHPTSIHATVSVLGETRDDGSSFKGVCSNYLADLVDGGKIRAFVRDSTFRLPSDASKPIIMIGPGTGIAPMRALLQERSHQKTSQNLPVGSNILYFGCKSRDLDFIYSDELKIYEKEGTLTKMHLAFSREQEQKVYVQHLLAKNSLETWKLIEEEGAYIYVCGGVKMGQDVSDTLRKIVSEHGNLGSTDSKKYLDDMASGGRYVQELWA